MRPAKSSNVSSLCVFCGAANDVAERYRQAAYEVGRDLADRGIQVVFGAGRNGLMGCLADGVVAGGGRLVGVLPRHFNQREIAHSKIDELIMVNTMHERKQVMADRSDGFLVLPGGFGTLDETFEAITWRQLGLHHKPIVILDVGDYWADLKRLIETIRREGFAAHADRDLLAWTADIPSIVPMMEALRSR